MPDARLHFHSPAWQSLPVAGLPPATCRSRLADSGLFFVICGFPCAAARPYLIETFAIQLVFCTLALAQVLAAFLLAASETNPVIRRTALRFGTPALLAISIEVNYHRRLPSPLARPPSAPQSAECNRLFSKQNDPKPTCPISMTTLVPSDKQLMDRAKLWVADHLPIAGLQRSEQSARIAFSPLEMG